MKDLVALLLLGLLGLAWCCSIDPGAINIARNGKASQSSELQNYDANLAIDGMKGYLWLESSCSRIYDETQPWWRLDMNQRYKVQTVVVSGVISYASETMKDVEVRIGDSPDNNNPQCKKFSDTLYRTIFCCDGKEGQYISVVKSGNIKFMMLCEVEVYGDAVTLENDVCW